MINAVILALVGSGLLAIFLDTVDWQSVAQEDEEAESPLPIAEPGDGPVTMTVTDIHQLIGHFEQRG